MLLIFASSLAIAPMVDEVVPQQKLKLEPQEELIFNAEEFDESEEIAFGEPLEELDSDLEDAD